MPRASSSVSRRCSASRRPFAEASSLPAFAARSVAARRVPSVASTASRASVREPRGRRLVGLRGCQRHARAGKGRLSALRRASDAAASRSLVARPAPDVVMVAARGLHLGRPGSLGTTNRRELVAPRPAPATAACQLGEPLGERTVGVGEGGYEGEVGLRDGLGETAPMAPELRLGRGPFPLMRAGRAPPTRGRRSPAPREGRGPCAQRERTRTRRAGPAPARPGRPSTTRCP